ncbi:DUF6980 family protein [Candidatus Tisiphia endosymbiont of Piscicola geometra]|uniref:DUF6980 family protein n=1 Tax=Candidatus Tisiphia endosymbiont of Piscicola geometra TaxID=3066273 RepID=UPI00312C8423
MEYSKIKAQYYCCDQFKFHMKEKERIIIYDPMNRSYLIKVNKHIGQEIDFCPWCGIKLPEKVSHDEWWNILEKEYNITDPRNSEKEIVPAEFWTDEWWKKRGL